MCSYQSGSRAPDTCGPDRQFHSNHTEGSGNYKNSSLRVDSITEDLNETHVKCVDGINLDMIGAYDICIVGKFVRIHLSLGPTHHMNTSVKLISPK